MGTVLLWLIIGGLLSLFWGGITYLITRNSFLVFLMVLVVFAVVLIVWGKCEDWRRANDAFDRMEGRR